MSAPCSSIGREMHFQAGFSARRRADDLLLVRVYLKEVTEPPTLVHAVEQIPMWDVVLPVAVPTHEQVSHRFLASTFLPTPKAPTLRHSDGLQAAATRVESDNWFMECSPANVGVWRVAVALENGEPDRAPVYARRVNRDELRTTQRRAHLLISTGRGLYLAGDNAAAVRHFNAAYDIAAVEVTGRPTVVEIARQMVRDARRTGSDELQTLAVRLRIDPLDPDIYE